MLAIKAAGQMLQTVDERCKPRPHANYSTLLRMEQPPSHAKSSCANAVGLLTPGKCNDNVCNAYSANGPLPE